jgi:adenine deaminase
MATYHASMTQNLLKTGLMAPGYRADFNIYEKSPELDLKPLSSPEQMFRKGEKIN